MAQCRENQHFLTPLPNHKFLPKITLFCTIDPHLAITPVPDARLEHMLKIYGSKKLIPATMQFVDIAGLVKGAASGEGLGNKF